MEGEVREKKVSNTIPTPNVGFEDDINRLVQIEEDIVRSYMAMHPKAPASNIWRIAEELASEMMYGSEEMKRPN